MRKSLLLILMILSFSAVTAHADHVYQEWDEGSTASWLHVTSANVVEVSPTGGLTGGDFGSSEWQVFNLDFDPDWADQQAIDAGWIQEGSSAPFAATMAHVYTVGIKGEGTGTLSLGIDHFARRTPPPARSP